MLERPRWISADLSRRGEELGESIKTSALTREAFADWLYPEFWYEADREMAMEQILSAKEEGDEESMLDWESRLRILEQKIAIMSEKADRRKAKDPEYAEAYFQVTSALVNLRTECQQETEREMAGASEEAVQEESERLYRRFIIDFVEEHLLF